MEPLLEESSVPTAITAEGLFRVDVQNSRGARYTLTCHEEVGRSNSYNSDVRTTTTAGKWGCESERDCRNNRFRLRFSRLDSTHAAGGRCVTGDTKIFSENGTLSARIFIHSNVAQSVGVFTLGLLPTPFDAKEEQDLFVLNLLDGVAKFGAPGHAASANLADLQGQWVTVSMTRQGDVCTTRIDRETGGSIELGPAYCHVNPNQSHLVINSRARGGASNSDAFVTFDSVLWKSAP